MKQEATLKVMTPQEVLDRRAAVPSLLLLDVRTEPEWKSHRIPGATLITLHELPVRLSELDPARETVVLCEHGIRSLKAANFLLAQGGFTNVCNMLGGMSEWRGPVESGPLPAEERSA